MVIGRDLVRLLQNRARLPEFESLWRDMILYPTNLALQFAGVQQLMKICTSRKFITHRLTSDMENKLVFLTAKVKFDRHKRFQHWFKDRASNAGDVLLNEVSSHIYCHSARLPV